MKTTIRATFIVFLFSFTCLSQVIKNDITGKILEYKEIKKATQLKDELHTALNSWIVKNYQNTKKGIVLNNSSKIILHSFFNASLLDNFDNKQKCKIEYTLEISIKDYKYKVSFNSFSISSKTHGALAASLFSYSTTSEDSFRTAVTEVAKNKRKGARKRLLKLLQNKKKFLKFYHYKKTRDAHVETQIISHCMALTTLIDNNIKQVEDDW